MHYFTAKENENQAKTHAIDGLQEEKNFKIYRLKGASNTIFDRLKSNILEKFGEGSKKLRKLVHSCKEQNRRIWITAIEHIKYFTSSRQIRIMNYCFWKYLLLKR